MNSIGDKRIDPPYHGGPPPQPCASCDGKFDSEDLKICDICGEYLCSSCNIIKPDVGYVMSLGCYETMGEEHNKNIALDRLAKKAMQTGDVNDLKEYLEARRLVE